MLKSAVYNISINKLDQRQSNGACPVGCCRDETAKGNGQPVGRRYRSQSDSSWPHQGLTKPLVGFTRKSVVWRAISLQKQFPYVVATAAILFWIVAPTVLGAMATYAEQTSLDRIESGLRDSCDDDA